MQYINCVKFRNVNQYQLSNHVLLLDIQKNGFKYSCYFTCITSKIKPVILSDGVSVDLLEFKLSNGELRYIPKVIYKYTFTKEDLLNLFNLEYPNSVDLSNTIKQWDKNNILNEWGVQLNLKDLYFVDLDSVKHTGILDIGLFQGKLSDSNWDIEVMKKLIANEEM